MALNHKPQYIVTLVMVIIGLCLVKGELQTLTHHPVAQAHGSAGGLLSFVVVGDWGRKGMYNQSQVALQVPIFLSREGIREMLKYLVKIKVDTFLTTGLKY